MTTYANWVAKVASLLVDELELEHGGRLRVDLPAHWLGPVVLGAAWAGGLEVVWDGRGRRGRDRARRRGPLGRGGVDASRCSRARCSRWAVRFPEPLPAGVHDLGVEVWSQPDAYVAWPAPADDDPAVPGAHPATSCGERPPSGAILTDGGRLLSETNPASPSGLASFIEPLARGGSLVLVAHAVRAEARADRGRRARHRTLRPRLSPPGRSLPVPRRDRPGARNRPGRALQGVEAAGVLLPHDQVGVAGQASGR